MKNIIGTLFIVIGIITLVYQGFTYTKHQTVAQIGDVKITADTQKTVYFPPLFGGLCFVTGLIIVVIVT